MQASVIAFIIGIVLGIPMYCLIKGGVCQKPTKQQTSPDEQCKADINF